MLFQKQLHTNQAVDSAVLPVLDLTRSGTNSTVHSGIRFDNDGDIYTKSVSGSWNRVGTWLLSGLTSAFSISRTIDSGTLTTDGGAGPNQLNTDRTYDVQNDVPATSKTTYVTFTLQNWNGGSPDTTYATRQYKFEATKE